MSRSVGKWSRAIDRRPLVAGNWKSNGSIRDNAALLKAVGGYAKAHSPEQNEVDVLVCPAFVHIAQAAELLAGTPVMLGAQNVGEYEQGAYTGEVSGGMLRELGCRYAIVGHSERRTLYKETNETVAWRFAAASRAALTPILCVGESLAQREDGKAGHTVKEQLGAVLRDPGDTPPADFVVAYEPVWAIGTGHAATPGQVSDMHALIRATLANMLDNNIAQSTRVVYGGSVNSDNAEALFSHDDVDGGLIGGASLDATAFNAICRIAHASCTG